MHSLLSLPQGVDRAGAPEYVEPLFHVGPGARIERIVSWGHVTPVGQWYDQEDDEWVVVLEGRARLEYGDGSRVALERGDQLLVPAHVRHRVAYTSSPCVWLAVFAPTLTPGEPRRSEDGRFGG